jgi:beta-glucosidase
MVERPKASQHYLPGVQENWLKLQATGKPVVVLINTGKPLVF